MAELQVQDTAERTTMMTPDGWIVDTETGEVLGLVAADHFQVTNLRGAEWVLEKMQETDAQILAETAVLKARIEAQQKRIDAQVRRREWLTKRFGADLEAFARQELEGKKTRTLQTGFGSMSFRKGVERITVTDEVSAVLWAKIHAPNAVKVKESILVSELKGRTVPDDAFEVVPATDKFTISTGVAP